MSVIRIEMTEEQFEGLIITLAENYICPSSVGIPDGGRRVNGSCEMGCSRCWGKVFRPETIPDKGKEG